MMDVITQTLGNLRCHVVQADRQPPTALAVFCHGYGASGTDLVSLTEAFLRLSPAAKKTRFVFPEAPIDLASEGMPGGRAWWSLDVAYLLERQRQGAAAVRELRAHKFAGLPKARRLLAATVEQALQQADLPYDRLVLGGFSQGAMLSCDLTWRLEEPPALLAILSGTLVDEPTWRVLLARRAGLKIVQSHGHSDPILPYANAEALRDLCREAGCEVDFVPFAGGHTIPPEALMALAKRMPGDGAA